MPQHTDSRFDALLEMYASTEVDRMDSCDMLRQYAYESLIEHFRDMTEQELIAVSYTHLTLPTNREV